MSKIVHSLKEAIELCALKNGMRISFHHHLRNGDHVINMVMNEIERMGLNYLTVNASSIFDVHEPIINHIKKNVVTGLEVNYMGGVVGKEISSGIMKKPVDFRSHGGRPSDIESGKIPIDVAFIAVPTSDKMGNSSGKYGKSACGSLGYAFVDAMNAKKVIIITDNLVDYPLYDFSIPETYVDYVVCVDSIGNASGIVSGTTKITKDPVGLLMADYATKVVQHSGLLKNGFSFQTGAGGTSLAVAKYLKELMVKQSIKGSFAVGGITSYLVDMLEAGCFETLLDVQCFDLRAVQSIRENFRHVEVSASHYASPTAKSSIIDNLDVVILGATQVDTDFNVNVHTDSNGFIIGGSGGHSDTAAGAELTIIVAPIVRSRLNTIVDKVLCISTPGESIDVLVTQRGIAVNPKRVDLMERLKEANLPIMDINDLKRIGDRITGESKPIELGDKVVGNVIYRDGNIIDTIKNTL